MVKKKSATNEDDDEEKYSDIDIRGQFGETSANFPFDVVNEEESFEPHVYTKRWIVLAVLSTTLAINACCLNLNGDFQSNIVIFYKRLVVSAPSAGWLAESSFYAIHIGIEILATVAAVLVLELRGLRITCLVGITLACLGAWIRSATLNDKMYSILFAGLVLCHVGQVYMASSVFYLSSKWFPHRQTATSISVVEFFVLG